MWHLYKLHENEPRARDMRPGQSNTARAFHSISEDDRRGLSGIGVKCWATTGGKQVGWAKLSLKPGVKRPSVVTFCKLPMHQCDRWRRGRWQGYKALDCGGVEAGDVTVIEKSS